VICGAPNAGKSSLLNRLLGFDRAIVNDIAGTTRDTIEELINLRGIPLRLVDTAGLREGLEAVEREGIERSRAQIAGAELILLVVDSSSASDEADEVEKMEFPEHAKVVRLLNKSDLPVHPDRIEDDGFPVSCLDESSIDALRDHLYGRSRQARPSDPVIWSRSTQDTSIVLIGPRGISSKRLKCWRPVFHPSSWRWTCGQPSMRWAMSSVARISRRSSARSSASSVSENKKRRFPVESALSRKQNY
jgi:small GTP-binding protein